MAQSTIIALVLTLIFGSLLSGRTLVKDSPEHALISAEEHNILAPGSSREFRYPSLHPKAGQPSGNQPWNAGQDIPLIEEELPDSLYSLTEHAGGWTLRLCEQPFLASVVVLGPVVTTPRGRLSWALRSTGPIGNTNKPEILWRGHLLGPKNGLHFLASSQMVDDSSLGKVFQIEIPRQAIYGYPEAGVRTLSLEKGSFIRIRLYNLAYGYYAAQTRTYRIPIR